MEQHSPDRIALVFGLLFTTIGVVSAADLIDVAAIDAGVAVGAALVVAAVLVVYLTLTMRRDDEVVTSAAGLDDTDRSTSDE